MMATVMAGVIMGLARMGSLIKFIPWPVTSGFTTGIAVAIMATQSSDFLGIRSADPAPREFLHRLGWIYEHWNLTNVPTLLLGITCAGVIFLWPKLGF